MSSTNKHSTTYSAADIEKYLKGELSPREMHDLENAALENPFLADALDGMSMLLSTPPAATHENAGNADDTDLGRDLDELHTRLNTRVAADRNKVRGLFPWWSVAASIILLLGIGYGVYYASSTSARVPAVASSPRPAEANTVAKDAPPPPAEVNDLAKKVSPSSSPTPVELPSLAKAAPPAVTEPGADQKAEIKADSINGTFATADVGPRLAASTVRPLIGRPAGITSDSIRIALGSAYFKRQSNPLVYRGIVLDNHNNPVPGASLILKGYTKTATVTDQQGQFSLHVRPQDSTQYLTVAMAGYEQKSLPLNTLITEDVAGHIIHLQSDENSFSEVEVTGYGRRAETFAAIPSTTEEKLDSLWQKARPVIGRNAYLQYLDTAQKTLALDPSVTGTEIVSFEVGKKGVLTDFKIEQSLSPAHDEAIIRLIKEGSAWQLLRQKKTRVVVSLHF